MGYFDAFNPMDPNAMARMGMLQAAGQAAMPTSVPTPFGAVMAQAATGAMGGKMQALQNRQAQLGYDSSALEFALRKAILGPYLDRIQGSGPAGGPPSLEGQGPGAGATPPQQPSTPAPRAPIQGMALGDWSKLNAKNENGTGNPAAPQSWGGSSAMGNNQFTEQTWLGWVKNHGATYGLKPAADVITTDAKGRYDVKDPQQKAAILSLRGNAQASDLATQDYARDNAPQLAAAGLPVTSSTLGLAHGFGPKGAIALLKADPNTPLMTALSPAVIKANPYLKQMTVGRLLANNQLRYGNSPIIGLGPTASYDAAPPANQFAGPGAPPAPAPAATPGGADGMFNNPLAMSVLGVQPTPYQIARYYADSLPPGPEKDEALAAAHHAAGYDLSINSREGSEIGNWNPNSAAPGGYDIINRNPKLPEAFVPGSKPGTYAPLQPDTAQPQVNTQGGAPAPAAAAPPQQQIPLTLPNAPAGAPAGAPGKPPFNPVMKPNTHTGNPTDYSVALPSSLDDFERSVPGFQPPAPLLDAVQQGQQPLKGKAQEALLEHDETRLEQYQHEQAAGQAVYNSVSQLFDILKSGLSTGNMTETATHLANYAHQMGMDNLIPKNFNPADADAFHKLATQLVFAQVKAIGGRPLVSEIEGLSKANPNESMTPEANADILLNVLADQRWRDARATVAKQYMGKYGYLGNFDSQFNQRFPEIDTTQALIHQAQRAGWTMPEDALKGDHIPAPIVQKLQGLKPNVVRSITINGKTTHWTLGQDGKPMQLSTNGE